MVINGANKSTIPGARSLAAERRMGGRRLKGGRNGLSACMAMALYGAAFDFARRLRAAFCQGGNRRQRGPTEY